MHQQSRVRQTGFSDGKTFKLPGEYRHMFSPAFEVQVVEQLVQVKADIKITNMQQQGNDAIWLFFDAGHDMGVHSRDTLYCLGEEYDRNWPGYLKPLAKHGSEAGNGSNGLPMSRGR